MRRLYADTQTDIIAGMMHERSRHFVHSVAASLGIRKSAEFLRQEGIRKAAHLSTLAGNGRFRNGIVPWNKGQKFDAGGRSVDTRFKRGNKPPNYSVIGAERVSKEGYLQRKVTSTGYTPRDWVPVHHVVWMEAGLGKIPPGHVLVFRDGNKRNFALDNLELITKTENMRRNSIHRYGPMSSIINQLRGAIMRQINKAESNEQT